MNRSFAQALSYLLHPAVFPLLGTLAVMQFSPYFIPSNVLIITLALVFTGTYVLPLAISYLLYKLDVIKSLEMKTAQERRIPYLVGAICYYFIATMINVLQLPREAYLFLLASTIIIVLHLMLLRFMKPSAHLGGIAGFTALLFALSLKFQINLLPLIALCIILCGFLASARLYLKAHTPTEIITGFLTGVIVVFTVITLG
ncbi:hypothetical protein Oweho_2206 [Owenweeksia hongkongensis DSM 17368]|uniref:PAP2 superfamily protein n=1 Tax=Owenweeksia hongkongensis (strain DSM 17368 / CIP 108786 / JCM 12287 / NRRL B-23963 / UST20020801) TaxID=926562 RepID=G8R4Q6_OWEHD|nr:phosphatase PAP2 family protein [Owenweeksia hongkongensis]AEV33180.1 hypothetical protein Oweho_2206 [Owenweeksia hongkongensis DSM 17368]